MSAASSSTLLTDLSWLSLSSPVTGCFFRWLLFTCFLVLHLSLQQNSHFKHRQETFPSSVKSFCINPRASMSSASISVFTRPSTTSLFPLRWRWRPLTCLFVLLLSRELKLHLVQLQDTRPSSIIFFTISSNT